MTSHPSDPSPDETPRALIERYVEAYNAFDVPAMLAVLHPDVEFENVSGGRITATAHGIDEFRTLAERAATIFASRRQHIREYVPEADGVRIAIDYEGVLAQSLGPELDAGTTLRLAGHSTFRFRDGRIVRIVDES